MIEGSASHMSMIFTFLRQSPSAQPGQPTEYIILQMLYLVYLGLISESYGRRMDNVLTFVCQSLFVFDTNCQSRQLWCLIKWILTANLATRRRQIDGRWMRWTPGCDYMSPSPSSQSGSHQITGSSLGADQKQHSRSPPVFLSPGIRSVRHQSAPVKPGPLNQGKSPLLLHTKPRLGALGQRCSSRLMYHNYRD